MDERVDRPEAGFEHGPHSRAPAVVVRRSRLRWVVGLIILLGAGLGIAWLWHTHQATQTTGRGGSGRGAQTPPQPVGAATIDRGDIRIILNELGTVTSWCRSTRGRSRRPWSKPRARSRTTRDCWRRRRPT